MILSEAPHSGVWGAVSLGSVAAASVAVEVTDGLGAEAWLQRTYLAALTCTGAVTLQNRTTPI